MVWFLRCNDSIIPFFRMFLLHEALLVVVDKFLFVGRPISIHLKYSANYFNIQLCRWFDSGQENILPKSETNHSLQKRHWIFLVDLVFLSVCWIVQLKWQKETERKRNVWRSTKLHLLNDSSKYELWLTCMTAASRTNRSKIDLY